MPENKDSERSPDYNFKTPEHEAAETSDEIFFESPEAYRKFREMVKNDLEGKPGGLLDKLSEEDRLLQAARLAGTEKKIEAESTRPFIEGLKPDIEIDPELEKELNEMAQQYLKKWENEGLGETVDIESLDVDSKLEKELRNLSDIKKAEIDHPEWAKDEEDYEKRRREERMELWHEIFTLRTLKEIPLYIRDLLMLGLIPGIPFAITALGDKVTPHAQAMGDKLHPLVGYLAVAAGWVITLPLALGSVFVYTAWLFREKEGNYDKNTHFWH